LQADTKGIGEIRYVVYRSHVNEVQDIYDLWPSAAAMARSIDVPAVTVRQWRNRGYRIPQRYWGLIREAGEALGADIPLDAFLSRTIGTSGERP